MDLKILLNTYAQQVLREPADQDYIAARMNCRMDLREQFLWSALQACEKYLKGILLFNMRSARFKSSGPGPVKPTKHELGHNLVRLFAVARTIEDLPLNQPPW